MIPILALASVMDKIFYREKTQTGDKGETRGGVEEQSSDPGKGLKSQVRKAVSSVDSVTGTIPVFSLILSYWGSSFVLILLLFSH